MNDTLDYFAESQIENFVTENLLKTQNNNKCIVENLNVEQNSILLDDSLFLQDYYTQILSNVEVEDDSVLKQKSEDVQSEERREFSQNMLLDKFPESQSERAKCTVTEAKKHSNNISDTNQQRDISIIIPYTSDSQSEVSCHLKKSHVNSCSSATQRTHAENGENVPNVQFHLNVNSSYLEVPETPLEKFESEEMLIHEKVTQENKPFVENESTDNHHLSSWGLPDSVLKNYEKRKISSMFDWQLECLSKEGVFNKNKNLVYSAPTSAGKTLVAEILAMKCLFERKKKVIFILPFISVVREKVYYFQDLLGSSGKRVEGFMGSYNPPGGFQPVHMAVGTIEKCNSLVNRLMQEDKLGDIGKLL